MNCCKTYNFFILTWLDLIQKNEVSHDFIYTNVKIIIKFITSGLPDLLFRIRPEPDPDLFFQINIQPEPDPDLFFQINIRPEPDPDLFFQIDIRPEPDTFKLRSGRNRNRILNILSFM